MPTVTMKGRCYCYDLFIYTALEREDRVAKFRFKYLGIVEVGHG